MINIDLFLKLLENQSINIEEEHNLYNDWLQFPNNKIKIYEYRFSNYLNKEYYIRCMSQLFSIVNFLEKNFNNIFSSYFNNYLRNILDMCGEGRRGPASGVGREQWIR